MEKVLLVLRGTPATVDDELDAVVCRIRRRLAQGTEERGIEAGYSRNRVIEDPRAYGDGTVSLVERITLLTVKTTVLPARDVGG